MIVSLYDESLQMNPCKGVATFSWYALKAAWQRMKGMCCRLNRREKEESEAYITLLDGSDPCWSHRSAIGEWTSQELDTQLVYTNVTNSTRLKPYAIFYDEAEDEVIIAIRGTLSLDDCITDALAEPARLQLEGDAEDVERWAHEGMLQSAHAIRKDIQQKQLLEQLQYRRPQLRKTSLLHSSMRQDLKIVVVGHSLGAGIATLLSVLMKRDYPSLECYSFGTPGSVVDSDTSKGL